MNSTPELFGDPTKTFADFVLKDYELKVGYLNNHFQRMWTRFNYFVVIETALIAGKTIFGATEVSLVGMTFGLALSLAWYVMGAEDRFLVELYRGQAHDAGRVLAGSLWHVPGQPYEPIGDVSVPSGFRSLSAWRIGRLSTTRLAALIPLAIAIVWAGLIIAELTKAPRAA